MTYDYNRKASLTTDPREHIHLAVESLQGALAASRDAETDKLLRKAMELAQQALVAFERSADAMQPMLEAAQKALEGKDFRCGWASAQANGFILHCSSNRLPRRPPDDDGPGDEAYYRTLRTEKTAVSMIMTDALRPFGMSYMLDVETGDKGTLVVHVTLR